MILPRALRFFVPSLLVHVLLLLILLLFSFRPRPEMKLLIEKNRQHQKPPDITTILIPLQGPQAALHVPQNLTPPVPPPQQPALQPSSTPKEPVKTPLSAPQTDSVLKTRSVAPEQQTLSPPKITPTEKPPPPAPPRRRIASLTSRFLRSLKDQGNSLMEREGKNETPTFEELKYLSYQRRIDEHLMTSWRIVSSGHRPVDPTQRTITQPARISFELDEGGELTELILISSSGDQHFDTLVLESIKQAVPFPPIPKHLGLKRYRPIGGTYRVQ